MQSFNARPKQYRKMALKYLTFIDFESKKNKKEGRNNFKQFEKIKLIKQMLTFISQILHGEKSDCKCPRASKQVAN